jgi:hypothetical protein
MKALPVCGFAVVGRWRMLVFVSKCCGRKGGMDYLLVMLTARFCVAFMIPPNCMSSIA